jgi:hypothetical protein
MKGLEKYENEAIAIMARELIEAKKKYPYFADDLFQAVALLGEEYGATCMAVNDHCFDGKPVDQVITEAAQQTAMGIRTICLALSIKGGEHGRA